MQFLSIKSKWPRSRSFCLREFTGTGEKAAKAKLQISALQLEHTEFKERLLRLGLASFALVFMQVPFSQPLSRAATARTATSPQTNHSSETVRADGAGRAV